MSSILLEQNFHGVGVKTGGVPILDEALRMVSLKDDGWLIPRQHVQHYSETVALPSNRSDM